MGKRKKKQSNNRGYETTNAPIKASSSKLKTPAGSASAPKKAATATAAARATNGFSSQDHQDLLQLLGSLDDEVQQTPTSNLGVSVSPDRFYKKLYNIHDALHQLGFTFETIQRAVVAQGYGATLDNCLDWLCLHCSTQQLPPLFTEGSVREQEEQQQQSKTSSPLQVLKPVVPLTTTNAATENYTATDLSAKLETSVPPHLLARASLSPTHSDGADDEQDSAKAWILQQYQFEQVEVDDDIGDDKNSNMGEVSSTSSAAVTPNTPLIPSSRNHNDPNQKRLQELAAQLEQQEAELKDDANLYMMSKEEIKQLQTSTKKLRQQVQGLKRKMERTTEAAKRRQQTSEEEAEAEESIGVGFFVGEEETGENDEEMETTVKVPDVIAEEQILPSDPVVPKDSVPSGWTGKTPKDILEDWCKKEKIRRPQFFKLPSKNGARIRVDLKPNTVAMETDNCMGSYADSQEYLASKVLYQVNPDLPLYRLFPPYYRDLWKTWSDAVRNEKEATQQEENEATAAKIQQLMDSVSRSIGSEVEVDKRVELRENLMKQDVATVPESWDDDDNEFGNLMVATREMFQPELSYGKFNQRKPAQPTCFGEQIRKDFQKRRKTGAYQTMLQARRSLPMFAFRDQILRTIKENPVTILCAEVSFCLTGTCSF